MENLQTAWTIIESYKNRPIALKHYVEEAIELIEEGVDSGFYREVLGLMMRGEFRGILSKSLTKENYEFMKSNSRSYEFLQN
jgi:hypothetical protein